MPAASHALAHATHADLDQAAGGCVFDADGCYEAVDNQGNVLERFPYGPAFIY